MAEVSVLFLGDWLESDVAPYLGFASSERQAAVARFRFASDKNRSLWAELFARWRLAETAGLSPAEIEISHDEKGKPFCKNHALSVSLSHSGAYIAVAVGQSAFGVDVERKRKFSLSVSRRWFRPKEHEFLTRFFPPLDAEGGRAEIYGRGPRGRAGNRGLLRAAGCGGKRKRRRIGGA